MSNDLPEVGTILRGRHKGRPVMAKLVLDPGGRPAVLMGRRLYTSLSAAAKAATGTEINGWIFWRDASHHLLPRPAPPKTRPGRRAGPIADEQ